MGNVAPYVKAFLGASVAGLGVISTSLADGGAITAQDYVSAAITFLVAFGTVFYVPYQSTAAPKKAK